jgi:hypothetical protein
MYRFRGAMIECLNGVRGFVGHTYRATQESIPKSGLSGVNSGTLALARARVRPPPPGGTSAPSPRRTPTLRNPGVTATARGSGCRLPRRVPGPGRLPTRTAVWSAAAGLDIVAASHHERAWPVLSGEFSAGHDGAVLLFCLQPA